MTVEMTTEMTVEKIEDNVKDVKLRKFIEKTKNKALADCAMALVNNEIRKNNILATSL